MKLHIFKLWSISDIIFYPIISYFAISWQIQNVSFNCQLFKYATKNQIIAKHVFSTKYINIFRIKYNEISEKSTESNLLLALINLLSHR